MSIKKAVLFDLDGTLIDTAPDFIRIIKSLCGQHAMPTPSDTAIREQVSAGARAMVKLMFNNPTLPDDDADLLNFRLLFLDEYEKNICIDSRLFDGLAPLLSFLESHSVKWGIVTNKPKYLAQKLLVQLGLSARCQVLICPDDVKNPKPDPESLWLACETLGLVAKDCLYVGDHRRDIEAGRRAGMTTVIASYGYIPPEDKNLRDWGADVIVESPADLRAYCEEWLKTD
ncbi:MAG: HAD-IA family hydrolase [Moraxella sp.]|nr:HAD-IA family hydrolase [Moraxella sp.]